MEHIGSHMRGEGGNKKRDRATERGEMLKYFMERLNRTRGRDHLPPLTMGRMGRVLIAIPTKDLYYLKSICDDAENRAGSADVFSKKFWWEVKPKKEEDKGENEKGNKK